jgi:hypothetical protein
MSRIIGEPTWIDDESDEAKEVTNGVRTKNELEELNDPYWGGIMGPRERTTGAVVVLLGGAVFR